MIFHQYLKFDRNFPSLIQIVMWLLHISDITTKFAHIIIGLLLLCVVKLVRIERWIF